MLSCCQIRHECRLISASAYRCQSVQMRSIPAVLGQIHFQLVQSKDSHATPLPLKASQKITRGAVACKGDISLLHAPHSFVQKQKIGFFALNKSFSPVKKYIYTYRIPRARLSVPTKTTANDTATPSTARCAHSISREPLRVPPALEAGRIRVGRPALLLDPVTSRGRSASHQALRQRGLDGYGHEAKGRSHFG